MDVAVRDCGGRGSYANSIEGRGEFKVWRSCAVGRNPGDGTLKTWLAGKRMAKAVVGEVARRDRLSRESKQYGARRSTQSFRVGESGFMQPI